MTEIRDWQHNRMKWIGVLERRTGKSLAWWNARVKKEAPATRAGLKSWLATEGVNGYGASILTMERFGYPEWLAKSGEDLVAAQYANRPDLRKVYDAVITTISRFKGAAVQTRKTYVSLLTPRRTFARVKAGKDHVKVALRLDDRKPGGRLQRSRVHDEMKVELVLRSRADLDKDAVALLRDAYEEGL